LARGFSERGEHKKGKKAHPPTTLVTSMCEVSLRRKRLLKRLLGKKNLANSSSRGKERGEWRGEISFKPSRLITVTRGWRGLRRGWEFIPVEETWEESRKGRGKEVHF